MARLSWIGVFSGLSHIICIMLNRMSRGISPSFDEQRTPDRLDGRSFDLDSKGLKHKGYMHRNPVIRSNLLIKKLLLSRMSVRNSNREAFKLQ